MNLKLVFTIGLLSLTVLTFGNQPPTVKKATVYSVVKQKQSPDWYRQQSQLWKADIDANSKNANAWLNYYTAQRMLKILHKGVSHEDLSKLVEEIGEAIPNTFEYHYIAYWNNGASVAEDNVSHLEKALEMGPNRVELLDDLFTHYYLIRDHDNLVDVSKKWFASNDMSPGVYNWNYNMLQSTEEDAILITSGDNDTYPSLVLQMAKGIRTDVVVLNNSLLAVDEYRSKHFKEIGLPDMEKGIKDYGSWKEFQEAAIEHIKKNTDRPLYFAVSAQPFLYASFKDEIYNVGMAYRWSKSKFDNIAVTKKNFEKNYLLDYLKIDLSNDLSQGVVDHANSNYLIPMLTLYNHYEESQDDKANEIEELINRIAQKNGMEEKVAAILDKPNELMVSAVVSDPRVLEKGMMKIGEKFYAGQAEVSVAQYELFLTDLLKQKRYKDLEIAKSEQVDWRGLKPEWKDLSDKELFPNGNPDGANYPVVNISHEATQMYCAWMTYVYNSTYHKKRAHTKVKFRLATEKEWEMLAKAGEKKSAYAWGGPYVRNSKGCFLANLDVSKVEGPALESGDCESCKRGDADGGYVPVPVMSYMPNGFGLYNMTGNVSEMVSEKGISKGGSWNTLAGVAVIVHNEEYDGPSPEVGFRVVMEIVE